MADSIETPAFEGPVAVGAVENISAPAEVGVPTVKTAHYPGSQQLQLWLPQSGYEGYGDVRVVGPDGEIVENATVRSRLNGSVQILWDTLPWPPGGYRIEITHDTGWRHVVALEKLPEGASIPAPTPMPEPEAPSGPRVYRDGFGNVIPDVDLELRKQAMETIANRFGRRLEYEGTYRAGVITYVEGARRIRFSHEMAADPYKFWIDVPSASAWEAATGAPVSEREEILLFVAQQVQREQASSWTFEIRETEILCR
jgi:hypothetical protein